MKRFEVGKEYHINGGGSIRILKRSRCYIFFQGVYERITPEEHIYLPISGKKKVSDFNLFGLGENIWISICENYQLLCCAGHEKTGE